MINSELKMVEQIRPYVAGKTCLITGVAGATGSICAEILLELGCNVVGVDNMFNGRDYNMAKFIDNPDFKFYNTDVTYFDKMAEIFEEHTPNFVIHAAAWVTTYHFYNDVNETFHNNVTGTQIVHTLAKEYGVENFLFCSTSEAYGDISQNMQVGQVVSENDASFFHSPLVTPRWSYATGKLMSEHLLIEDAKKEKACNPHSKKKTVICRYANLYSEKDLGEEGGLNNHLIPHIMHSCANKIKGEESTLILTKGSDERSRTMMHSRDAAFGTIIAMLFGETGELYNIGSSPNEELTVLEIAEMVMRVTGIHTDVKMQGTRAGDPEYRILDTFKLKKLGWTPTITLEQGIRMTWMKFCKRWNVNQ